MLPDPNSNPVRLARLRAQIAQTDLCRLTRKSLSTIRNAERGIATRATLAAIARALNVPLDELTGRKSGGE